MEKDKLYLDQEGYEQYLKEIEDLRSRLADNGKQKSSSYSSAVGDGWHDNFEFENAKREELKIMGQLQEKIEGLERIVIIDKKDQIQDSDTIEINDYVCILLTYEKEEPEKMIFKLVAGVNSGTSMDIISLSSPLGKAVYEKKVGDVTSYIVNGNKFYVQILARSKELTEELKNVDSPRKR